jgi:hypothetical protein
LTTHDHADITSNRVGIFEDRGVRFDGGLFMWEVINHDPIKIFSKVPDRIVPYYHW